MDITTIKLHKTTKNELNRYKTKKESYDLTIKKLLFHVKRRNLKNELIHAYKNLREKDLKTLNEWESASAEV